MLLAFFGGVKNPGAAIGASPRPRGLEFSEIRRKLKVFPWRRGRSPRSGEPRPGVRVQTGGSGYSVPPGEGVRLDFVRRQTVYTAMSTRKDPSTDDGQVVEKARPKLKKPSLYKVLLLNDDYTPMEFVVEILERFFSKPREQAVQIMLHVHQRGVGVCGVYTHDIAETKVRQVMDCAQEHQHPLQCTMEPEET